ncbi:MAG: biotin--[acetyl-CoA-carboxylase] ligase [Acidobacteria bacterium]|nr:MAG: biotin--[acetyl-CoA-carboxylase] ligase [Acidobacteriota bacterium]
MKDALRGLLKARGLEWAAEIEHLAAVGSTNDHLKQRARAGAAAWTVVIADAQTAGRGRQGRRWSSPPGNLHLSVLLRPDPPAARWSVLPLLAGVAVAEALAEEGLEVRLKWPNDIVAGTAATSRLIGCTAATSRLIGCTAATSGLIGCGRKLGGILAEAASSAEGLESVVMGVGVNVAVRPADLPPDAASSVTSIADELGHGVDRLVVAAAVLARLRVWYHALARDGPRVVQAAWRARALPWWGRAVEARSGERHLRGIARDLDEGGALILELEDGTRAVLHSGEVREVRPVGD